MRWNRYKILSASNIPHSMPPEQATVAILDAINVEKEQYQMGKTKV